MISVLTPSIPERAELLEECVASVQAQTYSDVEHLVGVDEERHGCAWSMNKLAEQAKGEWLFIFADDDLMLPGCLRTHLAYSAEADVVYSPPLVWGNGELHFFGEPPKIPSHALVRTSLWRDLGGYTQGLRREEDRDFWTRAMEVKARFVRADSAPTWIYRFSKTADGKPRNKSYSGGIAR